MASSDPVLIRKACQAIEREALRAISLFPAFNSGHEGKAVIKEELDELWDEVKAKAFGTTPEMLREATQVGAMAARFIADVCWKGIDPAEIGNPLPNQSAKGLLGFAWNLIEQLDSPAATEWRQRFLDIFLGPTAFAEAAPGRTPRAILSEMESFVLLGDSAIAGRVMVPTGNLALWSDMVRRLFALSEAAFALSAASRQAEGDLTNTPHHWAELRHALDRLMEVA
jgi:hypothetical protein